MHGIPYAFLYEFGETRGLALRFAHRLGASGFNPRLTHATRHIVDEAHGLHMTVWAYVADTIPEFEKALA